MIMHRLRWTASLAATCDNGMPGGVFFLTTVVLSVAATAIAYLSGSIPLESLFSSDALYLQHLYLDLFLHGGSYRNWYLTPAPYFFPDGLLFCLVGIFTSDIYYMTLGYLVAQMCVVAWGLFLLSRKALPPMFAEIAAAVSVVLVATLALQSTSAYGVSLLSASHFGVIVSSLFTLRVIVTLLTVSESWLGCLLLGLLCFLSTLSDKLFVIQCALPILAVLCLWTLRGHARIPSALRIVGVLLLSTAGGALAYPLVIPNDNGFTIQLGLQEATANVDRLWLFIVHDILLDSPLMFLLVGSVSLRAAVLVGQGLKKKKGDRPAVSCFIALFLIVAAIGTFAAGVLVQPNFCPRYGLSLAFFPVMLGPILLVDGLRTRFDNDRRTWITVGILVLIVEVLWILLPMATQISHISRDYYPEEIACIDRVAEQYQLRAGIATYWHARPIELLSKAGLRMAALFPQLEQMKWITTTAEFRPEYDFAIVGTDLNGPDQPREMETLIRAINGKPEAVETCGQDRMLIYSRAKLTTKLLTKPGMQVELQACLLPSIVGHKSNDCIIESQKKKGILSFGPSIPVPAGTYRFSFTARSPASSALHVGGWDIIINSPTDGKVLKSGIIRGSSNRFQPTGGEFSVPEAFAGGTLQVRSIFDGNCPLEVSVLRIERIH